MATKALCMIEKKSHKVLVECSVFISAKLKVKEMLWKSQKNCSLSMFQSFYWNIFFSSFSWQTSHLIPLLSTQQ